MALKSEPQSCIQPFWHIDCPVCGGENFTELGTGGGVWCDECNAEFKVRSPSDPGCVVDCFIGDVHNIAHHNGDKTRWRTALKDMGCYTDDYSHPEPKIYAYRIMKEPGGDGSKGLGTYCTDDRGWILSLWGRVLDKDVPEVVKHGECKYKYLTEPIVTREVALECGRQED